MSLMSIAFRSPSPAASVGGRGGHRQGAIQTGEGVSLCSSPGGPGRPVEVRPDDGSDTDAAVPGQVVGHHLVVELVIEVPRGAGLGRLGHRPAHALEELGQEHGLEFLGDGGRLGTTGGRARRGVQGRVGRKQKSRDVELGQEGEWAHMSSRSAVRAPARLMACRMAMRSRGVAPIAFSPDTTSPMEAPLERTASAALSSVTPMSVLGTTVVVAPRGAKGGGCDTWNSDLMWIERLPWETATVEIRTWLPMITVPVRSLTTILAGASTGNVTCSTRATKSTSRACSGPGTSTTTFAESIA